MASPRRVMDAIFTGESLEDDGNGIWKVDRVVFEKTEVRYEVWFEDFDGIVPYEDESFRKLLEESQLVEQK